MAFAILSKETHFNFVKFCRFAYVISAFFILLGIAAIAWNGGLRYGVDFAGGVMVQVKFDKPIDDEQVKQALNGVNLPGLNIQEVGSGGDSYLLRFASKNTGEIQKTRSQVMDALKERIPGNPAVIERLESVGAKVGNDLRNMAIEALFYAVLMMTVYISGRFEHSWFVAGGMAAVLFLAVYAVGYFGFNQLWGVAIGMVVTLICCWKLKLNFALGAILALMHDVMVVTGLITLLGVEIDLNTIAALLTIIGYSINDTIVEYDRIRENLRAIPADASPKPTMGEVINRSVNQTLARTIMTSVTTFVACLALYILGGSVIHDFALTMTLGVIFGTWSSIFIASPILLKFGDISLYHKKAQVNAEREVIGEHGVV